MQLRMTNQREMILGELKKSKEHLTADELYERVKKKMPRISLATVYRNLEILSDAGLLGKLEVSGRQKRFDWDSSPHDHICCVVCHRVDNLYLDRPRIENMSKQVVSGYDVTGYRLEFVGICKNCRKKMADKGKS